ncbi:monooxygenase [Thermoactinospora rubra]|uniref:monooxygenase n=1 Tax=Thermoactinospora rubra TaxID=1088767 RepID=UPI000A0F62EF|nr:monooxygenase [Thermoactinospora rubra]
MTRTSLRVAAALAALAVLPALAACGATRTPSHHASSSPHAAASPAPSASQGMHHAATTPAAQPLRPGERFATLTMPAAYTPKPPAGGTDEYRCFLLDPKLSGEDTFLTGAQFQPRNTEVVHHAILFRLDADRTGEARRMDAASPGEGWTCFGDAGVEEGEWIGQWAPGVAEVLLDPKLGYPMPAGSALVMQIHYSTLALGDRPAGADQSSVRLRLASGKLTPLRTATFPAPIELPCTPQEKGPLCERPAAIADVAKRFGAEAGQAADQLAQLCSGGKPVPGDTQHCDIPVEQPATIHAVLGHMHLLGRSISMELNPGKPGAKKLLEVPDYDFDNQTLRPLAEPVQVKRGDVIRVTCTHDASLRAQLPLLRDLPPRYVVWGEGTQDEMCLGVAVASPATSAGS